MISRFSAVDLQRRWADLGRRLSLSMNVIGSAWSEIEAAYAEPHRHYHTLAHIEAVLSGFDSHRQSFEDPDVAELALFYHDVIYDPSRQDNEVQSAARLYDRLSVH